MSDSDSSTEYIRTGETRTRSGRISRHIAVDSGNSNPNTMPNEQDREPQRFYTLTDSQLQALIGNSQSQANSNATNTQNANTTHTIIGSESLPKFAGGPRAHETFKIENEISFPAYEAQLRAYLN